jgi:colicin import membrane protein
MFPGSAKASKSDAMPIYMEEFPKPFGRLSETMHLEQLSPRHRRANTDRGIGPNVTPVPPPQPLVDKLATLAGAVGDLVITALLPQPTVLGDCGLAEQQEAYEEDETAIMAARATSDPLTPLHETSARERRLEVLRRDGEMATSRREKVQAAYQATTALYAAMRKLKIARMQRDGAVAIARRAKLQAAYEEFAAATKESISVPALPTLLTDSLARAQEHTVEELASTPAAWSPPAQPMSAPPPPATSAWVRLGAPQAPFRASRGAQQAPRHELPSGVTSADPAASADARARWLARLAEQEEAKASVIEAAKARAEEEEAARAHGIVVARAQAAKAAWLASHEPSMVVTARAIQIAKEKAQAESTIAEEKAQAEVILLALQEAEVAIELAMEKARRLAEEEAELAARIEAAAAALIAEEDAAELASRIEAVLAKEEEEEELASRIEAVLAEEEEEELASRIEAVLAKEEEEEELASRIEAVLADGGMQVPPLVDEAAAKAAWLASHEPPMVVTARTIEAHTEARAEKGIEGILSAVESTLSQLEVRGSSHTSAEAAARARGFAEMAAEMAPVVAEMAREVAEMAPVAAEMAPEVAEMAADLCRELGLPQAGDAAELVSGVLGIEAAATKEATIRQCHVLVFGPSSINTPEMQQAAGGTQVEVAETAIEEVEKEPSDAKLATRLLEVLGEGGFHITPMDGTAAAPGAETVEQHSSADTDAVAPLVSSVCEELQLQEGPPSEAAVEAQAAADAQAAANAQAGFEETIATSNAMVFGAQAEAEVDEVELESRADGVSEAETAETELATEAEVVMFKAEAEARFNVEWDAETEPQAPAAPSSEKEAYEMTTTASALNDGSAEDNEADAELVSRIEAVLADGGMQVPPLRKPMTVATPKVEPQAEAEVDVKAGAVARSTSDVGEAAPIEAEEVLRSMVSAAERKEVDKLTAADPTKLYTPRVHELLRAVQRMRHEVKATRDGGEVGLMLRAIMLDVEELGAASSLERLRSDAQAMHLCSILRERPSLLLGPLLPQLERLDGALFAFVHKHMQALAATVTGAVHLVVHEEAPRGVLAQVEYAEYVDRARLNAAKAAGDATLWLRAAQAASDATLGGTERRWTAPVQVVSRTRGLHRLRSNRHSRVRLIMRWVAPDT